MRRRRVVAYVHPVIAEAIGETASEWDCSVSDVIQTLIGWGVRALSLEAADQGYRNPVAGLANVLASGVALRLPFIPGLKAEVGMMPESDIEEQEDQRDQGATEA